MENKKTNWFVRSLIIVLCLLISIMLFYNFFMIVPKGEISKGLITLLILLIILVLSEAFDNISLGKILNLNRKFEEKKSEVKELKLEKQNLLNMLVNNISVQNQSVGISGQELTEILTVVKADPSRIEEETKEKEEELQEEKSTITPRKRLDFRKLENYVLKDFIKSNNLSEFLYFKQVTFSKNFSKVDPISNITPIFDGYIETENSEIFIEVKLQRSYLDIQKFIYSKLSSLYHYCQAKKVKVFLQLILVELPEDEENGRVRDAEKRIRYYFEPAIELGLLKVKYIKLTKQQVKDLYRK